MHPKDLDIAKWMCDNPDFIKTCQSVGREMPAFEPIHEGDTFDLGGLTLRIYECPGHTPGSVLVLLEEDRILFTGDAVNHHLWMQLDGCLPLSEAADALERLLFLEDKADMILHGHATGIDSIGLIRGLMNGIREEVDGKTADDVKYEWFGGDNAKMHVYKIEDGNAYQQEHHAVIYDNK